MALFQGRIIDRPELGMAKTELSSGGEVKHVIFASNKSLFLILERKLLMERESEYTAQLLLEMMSAAQANSEMTHPDNQRLHGLLTNLTSFNFYSYDPVKRIFAFDCESDATISGFREMQLGQMSFVTNKMFTIVLSGYISTLEAFASLMDSGEQIPKADYAKALEHANKAHGLFTTEPESKEDLEARASEALIILQQR